MSERSETSIAKSETRISGTDSPTTEDDNTPLTREEGLLKWMTPTGRQVEFHPIGSLWYWRLTGSGQQPPEAIKSNYTSLPRVKKSALEYLNAFWDLSDNRRKRK